MPIYKDTDKIKNLWLGTDKVKNIWKGTDKIYSGEVIIPSIVSAGMYNAYYSTNGSAFASIEVLVPENIRRIAFGKGKYVAIGYGNQGFYSTDGNTWTGMSGMTDYSNKWFEWVCFGNGVFVTCANSTNGAYYSTDGTTWNEITQLTSTGKRFYGVCFGDGTFYMTNSDYQIYSSTDGINWTHIGLAGVGSAIDTLMAGNGIILGVPSVSPSTPRYSTDGGVTWVTTSATLYTQGYLRRFCNGYFFVGASGGLYKSTDGINWSTMSYGGNIQYAWDVCYVGEPYNAYYIAGSNGSSKGVIMRSTNLSSWSKVTLPTTWNELRGIACSV